MITRIYVDNFRCLTNFDLELGETAVFLGANGTGKSAVFDVLHKVQQLIVGKRDPQEVFSPDDLSSLQTGDRQEIILEMVIEDSNYRYALTVGHGPDFGKVRIVAETLDCNGLPLFRATGGEAQLFCDDHTEGPRYPMDRAQSGAGRFRQPPHSQKLSRFRKELSNVVIVSPCPVLFASEARSEDEFSEDEFLESTMRNFVAWYRYVAQQDVGRLTRLFRHLAEIMPGFDSLVLSGSGEQARVLQAVFSGADSRKNKQMYAFHKLSDGQRALIALYSLLFLSGPNKMSLFIDLPDNYLSLREVQPWATSVSDAIGDTLEQAVVISHHPITIDYWATGKAKWFYRDGESPARARNEPEASNDALSVSELLARGWDRETGSGGRLRSAG